MTDAVASLGAASGASTVRAINPPSVVSADSASSSGSSLALKTAAQLQPLSPVVKADPSSGALITQYLSTSGRVETQFPSTVALAYLRQGLTTTGEKKPEGATTVA